MVSTEGMELPCLHHMGLNGVSPFDSLNRGCTARSLYVKITMHNSTDQAKEYLIPYSNNAIGFDTNYDA